MVFIHFTWRVKNVCPTWVTWADMSGVRLVYQYSQVNNWKYIYMKWWCMLLPCPLMTGLTVVWLMYCIIIPYSLDSIHVKSFPYLTSYHGITFNLLCQTSCLRSPFSMLDSLHIIIALRAVVRISLPVQYKWKVPI